MFSLKTKKDDQNDASGIKKFSQDKRYKKDIEKKGKMKSEKYEKSLAR